MLFFPSASQLVLFLCTSTSATLDSRSQGLLPHLPALCWSSFDHLLFMLRPTFQNMEEQKTFSSLAWKIRNSSLSLTDAQSKLPTQAFPGSLLTSPSPPPPSCSGYISTNVPEHTSQLLLYLCLPELAGSLLARLFPHRCVHCCRQNEKSALPTGLAWWARSHLQGSCGLRAHMGREGLGREGG